MVDNLNKGENHTPTKVYFTAEDGGMDVSKVVTEFNEEVFSIGFLGGRNGDIILDYLNENKIDNNFISTENETRACLSIVTEDCIETKISELSPRISGKEIEEFYNLYKNSIKAVDIICLSGDIPRGAQDDIYSDLVLLGNNESKKILAAISDEYLRQVLKDEPYLLNITLEDLEYITNLRIETNKDIIKLGSRLIEGKTEVIAIYKGRGNYIVLYNNLAYIVNLVDEYILVESGGRESFLAGFAVSELRNYDFEYQVRVSVACHIANSLEFESGLVNMKRMKSIMNELEIEILEI